MGDPLVRLGSSLSASRAVSESLKIHVFSFLFRALGSSGKSSGSWTASLSSTSLKDRTSVDIFVVCCMAHSFVGRCSGGSGFSFDGIDIGILYWVGSLYSLVSERKRSKGARDRVLGANEREIWKPYGHCSRTGCCSIGANLYHFSCTFHLEPMYTKVWSPLQSKIQNRRGGEGHLYKERSRCNCDLSILGPFQSIYIRCLLGSYLHDCECHCS